MILDTLQVQAPCLAGQAGSSRITFQPSSFSFNINQIAEARAKAAIYNQQQED